MNKEATVTVCKPAGSPATSSSRLPASSSSRATDEGSPPPSEHIAAVPVTEERNPKKPILLLIAGVAVVGFMVVLIVGTVILVRKDAKKLSPKSLVSATPFRMSRESATTTLLPKPYTSSASGRVSMTTGVTPGHETIGHVSSDEPSLSASVTAYETSAVEPNSSTVSELTLPTQARVLNENGTFSDTEPPTISTETVMAATNAANASSPAADEDVESHSTPEDSMTASATPGDEGVSVTKFSESAVAGLSGIMDVTVVRVDVSDSAQPLSTDDASHETNHTTGAPVDLEVEVTSTSTPGATADR